MKLCLLAPCLSVLLLAACSPSQPPVAAPQTEITVTPGPYQFCATVGLLLYEAPRGFPSFRERQTTWQKIYPAKNRSETTRLAYEASSWFGGDCSVNILTTDFDDMLISTSSFNCDGTSWKDPDHLFRTVKKTLRSCFPTELYVFTENKNSLSVRKYNHDETSGETITVSYYPSVERAQENSEHFFLEVQSLRTYWH